MKTQKTILAAGVLMMLVFQLSGCAGAPAKDLESFHFSYSTGNMMNASVSYDLSFENGVYTATVKPNLVPEEEAVVCVVEESFVQELEAFLQEMRVERWNGFRRVNKRVLDGQSFRFSYRTREGKNVSASGYMSWPRKYKEVKSGIESIFGKLLQE